jgi:hypothetical protein
MKKFILVSLFALAALGFASAATTGTVAMTGTVAPQLSLTLPSTFTATMDDTSGATNTWSIGNVGVTSNYSSWTISVASTNGGFLKNTANASETATYTMTLGSLATAKSLSSTRTSSAQTKTPKAGSTYALSIAFTASTTTFWQTGTYSDTLTVTIAGS